MSRSSKSWLGVGMSSSEEASKALRQAFMTKLSTEFFGRLRTHHAVIGWAPESVYNLATALVNDSQNEINQYLGANYVTLSRASEAIRYIIDRILMPKVERLTI